MEVRLRSRSESSKGWFEMRNLPLSILDMSSTSLISMSRWREETGRVFFPDSLPAALRSSKAVAAMVVMPMMAFMGVQDFVADARE